MIEHLARPPTCDSTASRTRDDTQRLLARLLARSSDLKRIAATRARMRRFVAADSILAA